MERTSHPGDAQNRCWLASRRIPAVLEMAFKSQSQGRSEAGEERNLVLLYQHIVSPLGDVVLAKPELYHNKA